MQEENTFSHLCDCWERCYSFQLIHFWEVGKADWEQRLHISRHPGSFSDLLPQYLPEPNSSRESETVFLHCSLNFAKDLDIEGLVGILSNSSFWEEPLPVTWPTKGRRVIHSLFLSLFFPHSLLSSSVSIGFWELNPGLFIFHAISLPLNYIPTQLTSVLRCGREVLSVNIPNTWKHLCSQHISVILLKKNAKALITS